MINGLVNATLEATIPLQVQGASGQSHPLVAIIDTGFSGFLTLSSALTASLGLSWLCCQQGLLADGSTHIFNVYMAIVAWDGQPRPVETEEVDTEALVGMAMLQGHDLRIRVAPGGIVSIEAIP
jgi:clan AA aspartic protease